MTREQVAQSQQSDAAFLESIYARIPRITCKGKCSAYCGPVPAYPGELIQIVRRGGARAGNGKLDCPYLNAKKRCDVYAVRPLVCRLWGVVKKMKCPHGCRPARWLSDAEAHTLTKAIRDRWPGLVMIDQSMPDLPGLITETIKAAQ